MERMDGAEVEVEAEAEAVAIEIAQKPLDTQ